VTHGENGLLVPRNDHDAMAAWAIRLLQSPDLAQSITRNAYDECAAYTWPSVRDQWLAVYSRLAANEFGDTARASTDQVILGRG
ncbi:MAG TPA: glycosyltransferase, partial [Pyrinomonadaceae bacterium]